MKIAGFPIVTHTIQSLNLGKMINGKEDERQLSLLFVDIFVTKNVSSAMLHRCQISNVRSKKMSDCEKNNPTPM